MQSFGHVIVGNEKILVLIRKGKKIDKFCYAVRLKRRISGSDGTFLSDESEYLSDNPDSLDALRNDKTVEL